MVPRKLSESFRSLTQVLCPTLHHLTLIKGKTSKQTKNKHIGSYKTNICDFIKLLLLLQPFSKRKIS
jgi:hypothetical protein